MKIIITPTNPKLINRKNLSQQTHKRESNHLNDAALMAILTESARQDEQEKKRQAEFISRNLSKAFEIQAKEVIFANLDKFYEMDKATAYVSLLKILAQFNEEKG